MEMNKIVAAGLGVVLIGSLAWAGVATNNANVNADAVANALSQISAIQADNADLSLQIEQQNANLAQFGVQIEDLNTVIAGNEQIIADYEAELATVNAELETVTTEAEVPIEFNGYETEETISDFEFNLTDNQFDKLGDYNVEFDGEDVSVNEFLLVKGEFENEKEVSMNFEDGDVSYKVEFDSGLNFSEDSLEISFLGKEIEITDIGTNEFTIKQANKIYSKVGDITEDVELVNIGEDAVIVRSGDEMEILRLDDKETVNGIEVELISIFYSGDENSMAVLRIGEELDTTIEVGDFYDEAENWEYATITNGEIVLTLAEDFDEVSELVLPNNFATISFELSDEDYNDVKLYKEDGNLTEVRADFEDYDDTKVEFDGINWTIDGDSVLSLKLKDSDYTIDFSDNTKIWIGGIFINQTNVGVSGDDDELFITEEGIIVEDHDSWNEDDDDELVISVPEEAVVATVKVE